MDIFDDSTVDAMPDFARFDPQGVIEEAGERAGLISRGRFIGALAGGAAALGLGAAATTALGQRNRDTVYANFALTLEYLQAAFYSEAERMRELGPQAANAAKVIGAVERAHVSALRDQLGRQAVRRPFFDFRNTTVDDDLFIETAVAFEDFSAAAYLGALPQVSDPALASGVAEIHSVEARHAAWIRFLQGVTPASQPLDDPISAGRAQNLVDRTRFIRERPATTGSGEPPFTG